MSSTVTKAGTIAVAATLIATLFSADGSGAAAKGSNPLAATEQAPIRMISQPIVQPLPSAPQAEAAVEDQASDEPNGEPATTLAALIDDQPQGELSRELNCLAGAIYFESKGEPLEGQLAVGRVIVARSKSGRYPGSYCGVVYQPSQFSFVRGNSMPGINKGSQDWREAVAIARIADAGSWRSPVEGALSVHAARVSPGWRMARVARVGNHIFYR
jgi:spore germination cell wall hydrolase CwlJ-like protein